MRRRSVLGLLFALYTTAPAGVDGGAAPEFTPCRSVTQEGRDRGIDIVDDPACALGTVPGCITAHCRFCEIDRTPDTWAEYLPCLASSSSAVVLTPKTPASQSNPSLSNKCLALLTAGQIAMGLSAALDATCSTDSMGCLDSTCRLCRLGRFTAGLDAFRDCNSLPDAESTTSTLEQRICGMQVSPQQAEMGVVVVTDPTCTEDKPGCLGVCRFCKLQTSTATGIEFCDSPPAAASTPAQVHSNVTPSESACGLVLLTDQKEVGLDVVTDYMCAAAGLNPLAGCLSSNCRLCKLFDSEYTEELPSCEMVTSGEAIVPLNSTAITTDVGSEEECLMPSPPLASELGLFVVTDLQCSLTPATNGFGCLSATCRVCKVFDTTVTSSLLFCESSQLDSEDFEYQGPQPLARDDYATGDGSDPEESSDGKNRSYGVSELLSASGMIAVVAATFIVASFACVAVKRLIARRALGHFQTGRHVAI